VGMSPQRLMLLSACGALAARPTTWFRESSAVDAKTLPQWGDVSWKEPCWGTPDPLQQLNGEVLESICARLHQNASFLVFGLGRDSALWYKNAIGKKIMFLENHEDWLQFQDEDVTAVTRIVNYTSDASAYVQELQDQNKLAELFESLPSEVKDTHWDMILVDSPMGMERMNEPGVPEAGTPGRTQSVYAARRLAQKHTLIFVDDYHRKVEQEAVRVLLHPNSRTLKVFSSGHTDNNHIVGATNLLIHDP